MAFEDPSRRDLLLARVRNKIRDHAFFTAWDFEYASGFSQAHASKVLNGLIADGVAVKLARGVYGFLDGEFKQTRALQWRLVDRNLEDWTYLISFHTALELHGLLPASSVVEVKLDRSRAPLTCLGLQLQFYRSVDATRTGSAVLRVEGMPFDVATPERAIVDLFGHPVAGGGILRLIETFRAAEKALDFEKLTTLALEVGWQSMLRRLGFVMEQRGAPEVHLARMKAALTRTLMPLEAGEPVTGATLVGRWRLRLTPSDAVLLKALR